MFCQYAGAGLCGGESAQRWHADHTDADKLPAGVWRHAAVGELVGRQQHQRFLHQPRHQVAAQFVFWPACSS